MNLSGKNKGLIVLFAAVLAVMAWQVWFVLSMPDGDTDAYAHFIIARDIVRNPYDLGLHWVWLPLFHYIDALFVLAGAGLQAVRFMNMLVWASLPFVLYFYLFGKTGSVRISLISGLLMAGFPLGILMGTTGQPEPLFTLSLLLFVIFFDKEKFLLSSLFITAACMMRYEAWAALGFMTLFHVYSLLRKKEGLKISLSVLMNVILPAVFLIAWVLLRRRSDGEWFQFLHGTVKFAGDALGEGSPAGGGVLKVIGDLLFYVFWVPFLFTGVLVLSIPFGFRKFISGNRVMFISGLGVLVFITASWVFKSNLGLNRHFTSLIPLYAAMTGYGIDALIGWFANIKAKRLAEKIVPAVLVVSITVYAVIWLYQYRLNNNKYFDGRFRAAECIRNLDSSAPIICNDPMIEIFSGLDYRRFGHYFMSDSAETNSYVRSMQKTGDILVVKTSSGPFIEAGRGELLFEMPPNVYTKEVTRIYMFRKRE
ncbi:MAG: hypothetical protein LWX07_08055 [Bacteroidetes bacterium]|nr:hypothetical protein [Bacteroidota bacterium]